MNCREYEAWLAQGDGTPGGWSRAEIEAHEERCPTCLRLGRGLARLEEALADLADGHVPEPPVYLKTRIQGRISAEVPERSKWRAWPWALTSRRILAGGVVALAFFAGLLARELHRVNDWMEGRGNRPFVIEYAAPEASKVELVGDFNGWGSEAGEVRVERREDRWLFHLNLQPGRYQYGFLVDGKRWLPDPGATGIIPDGFGGLNSVLYVEKSLRSRPSL